MCMILFPKVVVSISGSVCSAHTKTHFGEDPFSRWPEPAGPATIASTVVLSCIEIKIAKSDDIELT